MPKGMYTTVVTIRLKRDLVQEKEKVIICLKQSYQRYRTLACGSHFHPEDGFLSDTSSPLIWPRFSASHIRTFASSQLWWKTGSVLNLPASCSYFSWTGWALLCCLGKSLQGYRKYWFFWGRNWYRQNTSASSSHSQEWRLDPNFLDLELSITS